MVMGSLFVLRPSFLGLKWLNLGVLAHSTQFDSVQRGRHISHFLRRHCLLPLLLLLLLLVLIGIVIVIRQIFHV